MASVDVGKDHLALVIRCRLLVLSKKTGKVCFDYTHTAERAVSKGETTAENENRKLEDDSPYIIQCKFSTKGSYVAVCTSDKMVIVWETSSWTVVMKKKMPKRPMKLIFTNSEDNILVADKAGDVCRISLGNGKSHFLLGHLSVILDMKLTIDNKILITSDRDKKIRLSEYPNCYTIDKFLLAHTNFVCCFGVTTKGNHLITGGGDGKILLWDYSTGQIEDCVTLSKKEIAIPRSLCIDEKMNVFVIAEKLTEIFCFKVENERLVENCRIFLSATPLDIACVGNDIIVVQKTQQEIVVHFRLEKDGQYHKLSKNEAPYLEILDQDESIEEPYDDVPWNCESWRVM